eukprot:TRINITY_DN2702_c0_g1_i1.p1 TRINITY_DN2702_c0_g1~~TRINITY_DN2702_c0_g1_i1.p1  ORF type:complete len:281 (-),score=80.38 TRINITY_DN2702_c0_g1_i1:61-903(-)
MGLRNSVETEIISKKTLPNKIVETENKKHSDPINFAKEKKKDDNNYEIAESPLSPHNESLFQEPNEQIEQIPTVFRWNGSSPAKEVFLIGKFQDKTTKLKMVKSENEFSIILNLPPGTHKYYFLVDGKRKNALDQSITSDFSGNTYNTIEISSDQKLGNDNIINKITSDSPPGEYNQNIQMQTTLIFNSSKNQENELNPPSLPPHLQRALLNSDTSSLNPNLLPIPHHVMLNHLYLNSFLLSYPPPSPHLPLQEEKIQVLGISTRYKSKFVTTVLYSPQL